jgi:hypothetical protein
VAADVTWMQPGTAVVVLPAQLSVRAFAPRLERLLAAAGPAAWVVLQRAHRDFDAPLYYAFRADELRGLLDMVGARGAETLRHVLDLREQDRSLVVRGRLVSRVELPPTSEAAPALTRPGRSPPSARRVVRVSSDGRVAAVGEWGLTSAAPPAPAAAAPEPPRSDRTRGGITRPARAARAPTRGMAGGAEPGLPRAASPAATAEAVLSAETRAELAVGALELVEFRIERADGASPLAHAVHGVEIGTAERIRVVLSVNGGAVHVVGSRLAEVDPPGVGAPAVGEFEIRAASPGTATLAVSFRQGGSELGAIRMTVQVVAEAVTDVTVVRAEADIAPRDPADDDALTLLIEQRSVDGGTIYEYRLASEPLGLHYLTLRSRPLLDRTGSVARDLLAYVAWIYERVTRKLQNADDAKRLQREVRALGMTLCDELLSPAVNERLWPLRDRIRTVRITSWEPYVPWELVRLKDPATGDPDDRFLAEYGLVRTMHGDAPPRALRLRDWKYLAATYPNGTEASVRTNVDFLMHTLPAQGIQPREVTGYDGFWETLEAGDFDVLHLACHGLAPHEQIEKAVLVIGDRAGPGGTAERVEVDAVTVRQDARLRARRPLVFLHACEAGRHGPGLTAWGGWPSAFLEAGAGAFVGASWPVRAGPAERFATAFYQALFDGRTLSEAATAARLATKPSGDASWLAFKVYGHPGARRSA